MVGHVPEGAERAREAGLIETDSPHTVAELAAEFLASKKATKPAKTVAYYRKNLQRLVVWFGSIEGRKLHLMHSHQFISRLKEAGLSACTINHHLRSAKAVLNYAVQGDRLHKNPWKGVDELPEWGRKRVVTDLEFERLLKACDGCVSQEKRCGMTKEENAQLMKDILRILRFTALRPGELRKLRWDHLHLDNGFIIIPAAEHKTGTTSRNPQDRMIPVLEEATAILSARAGEIRAFAPRFSEP